MWPIAAVAAGAAALAAAAGWFVFGRTADARPSFEQTRLTFNNSSTAAGAPALSRDGKLVVYSSNRAANTRNLWLPTRSDCPRAGNRRANRWPLRICMRRMRSGTLMAWRWAPTRSCC